MVIQSRSSQCLLILAIFLSACGGSGNQSTNADDSDEMMLESSVQNLVGEIPSGTITQYGALTVGDESGLVSDLVAAFFEIDKSLSAEFLLNVFDGSQTLCTVDEDDSLDFEEISVGFIPSFTGINKTAISAGESIALQSEAGTFATLQSSSAGPFLFYTGDATNQPVPENLSVDVLGESYPTYNSVLMPTVSMLDVINYTGGSTITATTQFNWTPSTVPGSLIRIFSTTAGGFFVEDGVTLTCLAPDTGSFEFPASVQEQLGANFVGGAPILSRLTVQAHSTDNSILFLIRESFVP